MLWIRVARRVVLTCIVCLAHPIVAGAREQVLPSAAVAQSSGAGSAVIIDGPAPPVPPAVINRDAQGRATVRAVRLLEPLRLDGRLDEAVYRNTPAMDGFLQQLPVEGTPATEPSEAWVFYDAVNLYVAARCWDSADPSEWVANEMRRDTSQLRQNDTFGVMLDTFYDRRNGFAFYTNPLGAIADYVATNEGNPNPDWNVVWDVRTGRFEGGWTVEMQIPLKSLRYRSAGPQVWGIQFRRVIRRKNEWTFLTRIPSSAAGPTNAMGLNRISLAATLVGLDLPAAGRNLEVKPYGITRLTTDRAQGLTNDADAGVDVKYGLTPNLTADFTYNTDFAQVEVDEQQLNLTRFSLFFPEKREFFLEGRGLFDFGRGSGLSGGGGAGGPTPLLFFSRRIGLERGRSVPIAAGGRLTGKVGAFGLGLLNIQTDAAPAAGTTSTNFTVLRLRRDLLRRSSVGAMFTNRSASALGPGSNQAYGVDAAFSFYQDLNVTGYLARTRTPGLEGNDVSYQMRVDYLGDRYGLQLDQLRVGDHFNPEVGFLNRADFQRTFGLVRFSPRPRSLDLVRRFIWEASVEYVENGAGAVETRRHEARFSTEFETSDQIDVRVSDNHELIVRPFRVAGGGTIPAGAYRFRDITASYGLGTQRRANGAVTLQHGSFYNGTLTALGFGRGRVEVTPQLSLEPSVSINWIDLPARSYVTKLVRNRADFAFTPRMFVGALVQYSSSDRTVSSNLRFRWEYRPGSELFIVYTDERDSSPPTGSLLQNRGFVVKLNRLLRF